MRVRKRAAGVAPTRGFDENRSDALRFSSWFRRCLGDDRGQDLVEFGLTLPLLALLLYSIIESGLIYQSFNTISNAAREGARYGAIFQANEGPATCAAPGGAIGSQAVCRLAAGLDPSRVTYQATRSGQILSLQVSYQYTFANRLVSGASGAGPALTLTASSAMHTE